MLNHVDWVGLSRFKSITSQNTSQYHPIHYNPYGIKITEQDLSWLQEQTTGTCRFSVVQQCVSFLNLLLNVSAFQ
jgi:hypothetical protein